MKETLNNVHLQFRRSQVNASDPFKIDQNKTVLRDGEPFIDLYTRKVYVGQGGAQLNSLPSIVAAAYNGLYVANCKYVNNQYEITLQNPEVITDINLPICLLCSFDSDYISGKAFKVKYKRNYLANSVSDILIDSANALTTSAKQLKDKTFVADTINICYLDISKKRLFFPLSTAEEEQPKKLGTPTIALSGNILTISSIDTATEEIVLYAAGSTTYSKVYTKVSTIDLSTVVSQEGTYTITVLCRADGYINSDSSNPVDYTVTKPITKLSTPMLSISGSVITISNVDSNATNTVVTMFVNNISTYSKEISKSQTSLDLTSFSPSVNHYTISAYVKASGYADSDVSNSVSYTQRGKLATPVIEIVGDPVESKVYSLLIGTSESLPTSGYDTGTFAIKEDNDSNTVYINVGDTSSTTWQQLKTTWKE